MPWTWQWENSPPAKRARGRGRRDSRCPWCHSHHRPGQPCRRDQAAPGDNGTQATSPAPTSSASGIDNPTWNPFPTEWLPPQPDDEGKDPWQTLATRQARVEGLRKALEALPAEDIYVRPHLTNHLKEAERQLQRAQPAGTQLDSTKAYLQRAQKRLQLARDQAAVATAAAAAANEQVTAQEREVLQTQQRIQDLERQLAGDSVAAATQAFQQQRNQRLTECLQLLQAQLWAPTAPPATQSPARTEDNEAEGEVGQPEERRNRERSPRRTRPQQAGGAAAMDRGTEVMAEAVRLLQQALTDTASPLSADRTPDATMSDL